MKIPALLWFSALALLGDVASAATYDVGPGQPIATLSAVPWASLAAGDIVNIHWQAGGYHEKILISTQGTVAQHIMIRGISDPSTGAKPIIDGSNALEAANINYRYTVFSTLGVVVFSRRNGPAYSYLPAYIDFENLDIRNARGNFTDYAGMPATYLTFASAIYAEVVQHLVLRDCDIHDSGNGLFINSKNDSLQELSKDILVERCHFFNNGSANNYGTHNSYTEALGITYQYNWFGPLVTNSGGQSIKDRSSGTVIRYNYFENNYQVSGITLHLVDTQGLTTIAADPAYKKTFVYGNVFDSTGPLDQLIIYGGSQGNYALYRHGTLYFYNNTVLDRCNHAACSDTTLFTLPKLAETGNSPALEIVDCRNNIFASLPTTAGLTGPTLHFLYTDAGGTVNLGANWISPGWCDGSPVVNSIFNGNVTGQANMLTGSTTNSADPGFVNVAARDFHLAAGANAIDAALGQSPQVAGSYDVTEEYIQPFTHAARPSYGSAMDLGAYESNAAAGLPNTTPQHGAVQLNFARLSFGEGAGTVTLTALRSGGSAGAVTASYAFSSATATSGTDFIGTNGTVTWASGDTTPKTFQVQIVDDTIVENAEYFYVTLGVASGGAVPVTPIYATVTINDNDSGPPPPPAGSLQFSAPTLSVNEGAGSATLSVTRTGGSTGAVSVNYATANGTAVSGADFTAANGTLNWATGDATAKTITVPIIDDALVEGNETFTVTLGTVTGGASLGTATVTVTIIDNDIAAPPPNEMILALTAGNNLLRFSSNAPGTILSTVAITGLQANENMRGLAVRPSTGELFGVATVSPSAGVISSSTLYVINTITGAASVIGSGPFTPTLTNASIDLGFDPISDQLRIVGSTGQNLRLNAGTGLAVAMDTALAFAAGDAHAGSTPAVVGGDYSGAGTFFAIDSTLDILVRVGTATSANSGQLTTIGSLGVDTSGQTSLDVSRATGTAFATLTAPSGTTSSLYTVNLGTGAATLIGTIGGPEVIRDIVAMPAGSIAFTSPAYSALETQGAAVIGVTRTGGSNGIVSVNFSTSDGTANAGSDYTATSGTLTWLDGEIGAKTFSIPIVNDSLVEGAETVNLSLTNVTGGAILSGSISATLSIYDPPYQQWKLAVFGANANNAAIAGDLVTPASDGIPNLQKYAFGLNPGVSSSPALPQIAMLNGALAFSFFHDPAATDTTLQVEVSTDLVTWQQGSRYSATPGDVSANAWTSQLSRVLDAATGIETITVQSLLFPANNARCFMRVRVTQP
ncbi:MAG: Calx-beta domain-containing protein [Chthoniobacteraceae bacterium]